MTFALEESMPTFTIRPKLVPAVRISATFTLFCKLITGSGKGPAEILPPPENPAGFWIFDPDIWRLPLKRADPGEPDMAARLKDFSAMFRLAAVVGPGISCPLNPTEPP